jgi:DNA-binding IclR family transcriptional regulator
VQIGEWTYCHCSGLGKVLLAWSEPDLVSEAIRERGLPALTGRTVRTASELAAALEVVRSAGFALDDEESAVGLRCVAAAIRDGTGKVVAAISLSSPADRLAHDDALRLAPRIISSAGTISRRLGWFGESGVPDPAAQLTEIGR